MANSLHCCRALLRGVRGSAGSAPRAGILVSASGQASLVQALQQLVPRTAALYCAATSGQPCRRTGHVRCGIRFAVRGIWQRRNLTVPTAHSPPPLQAWVHTGGRRRAPRQAAILCRPSPESALGYLLAADAWPAPVRAGPAAHRPTSCPAALRGRRAIDQFDPDDPGPLGAWLEATMASAGRGGAACDSSPARTASASTCGRR